MTTTNNRQLTLPDFLSAFFPDESETINIRTFGAKGVSGITAKTYSATRNNLRGDLSNNNFKNDNKDGGIYFVVNSGGNKDDDITRFNAFFMENDELSLEEQHKALNDAPLQPSIRVETKKSIHAYWLISGDCSVEEWKDIQARLIAYFNGDKKIKNPSRCMRLPFFNHVSFNEETNQYENKLVEVKDFQSDKRFTVQEMTEAFSAADSENSQVRDECDNCDDSKPTYEYWEELNTELGRRIMQAGKINNRGKYEVRCPVHNGKTSTSLFFDPNRKTMKCLKGCSHSDLLQAFGLPTKPEKEEELKESKPTQASLITALAEEIELFVSQNDEAYATVPVRSHYETWAINSKAFESWIAKRYYQVHNQAPTKYALEEAIDLLAGEARFGDTEKKEVFTRIAELDGVIYLDLVSDDWEVVKITPDSWEVAANYPVKFRRNKGMKSLPVPQRGGSLEELNRFLNIQDDDLKLAKAWLLACLKPNMPYPILVLQGEQGSAKSTACEILCELIDPNINNLRSSPKDERDLAISTTNRLVVCLDNLSGVRTWLSDTLCKISTGGGFSTRKLHSDSEEMIFNLNNPILLNGIDEIATRSDLLDRSIVLNLQTIETRKPKQEFWNEFEQEKPKIIGALLDAFCEAMRNIDSVKLEDYPRMADFTKLATAGEKALGLDSGEFVDIYNKNRNDANKLALEYSLIAPIIIGLVSEKKEWVGIAKEIKDELDRQSDILTQRNPYYPKSSLKVSNDLKRIAPNLRLSGIDVKFDADEGKREAGTGNRLIRITRLYDNLSQSSHLSQNDDDGQPEIKFW